MGNRTCSICLDDDIPREQLSITSCAHVFHTDCIAEVAAKLGNCPVCRGRLDATKDLTRLAAEEAPAGSDACTSEPTAEDDVARRFGSKLAAMAARLQAIRNTEKRRLYFANGRI